MLIRFISNHFIINCNKLIKRISNKNTIFNSICTTNNDVVENPCPNKFKISGYEAAKSLKIRMPIIILVSPYLDQNVGSVARAMLNFGLYELRIVDPRCNHKSDEAIKLAAGASDILFNAKIYNTLNECILDLQRVMATTIRPRHMTQNVLTPSVAANEAIDEHNTNKVGILFGRERSGLTNEEVALSDCILSIECEKQFSSLNLAQAVNIVGFELWKRQLEIKSLISSYYPNDNERLVYREELDEFFNKLEGQLKLKNFQLNESRQNLSFRNIRNIFQRTLIKKSEVDILHGVLTSLINNKEIDKN